MYFLGSINVNMLFKVDFQEVEKLLLLVPVVSSPCAVT